MKRQTALSSHIVQFARFLRSHQYNLGPEEEQDALTSLTSIDWSEPTQFKQALKTTFCKGFDQSITFDSLYSQYWSELTKAVDSKQKDVEEERPQPQQQVAPSIQVIKNWLHGHRDNQEEEDIRRASDEHGVANPDLAVFASGYQREWREVVLLLQRYVEKKKSRRRVHSRKPAELNYRKILRQSMLKGGEIHQFDFKKRKLNRTNILLFCDVSKSMELYSKFIIQMMYALQNSSLQIYCYVFSTRLQDISRRMRRERLSSALKGVSDQVADWSGGTLIGSSLEEFLEKHARKVLRKNTFSFIVSDGWDAGDIALLEKSLRRLKSRSEKLLWINPLAKTEDFQPRVMGMKAAMPYIDHLIPALNVSTLKRHLGGHRQHGPLR